MELGEKLKHLRLEAKISQLTLADELNVSRATLSAWENGKTTPPVDALLEYYRIFDLEPSYFDLETSSSLLGSKSCFDTTVLNYRGIKALQDLYDELIKNDYYLKNLSFPIFSAPTKANIIK